MTTIHLLSGGAAQGLVTQLEARFQHEHQADIDACFGAVGLMRDNLLSGAPCDLVILTEALIAELTAGGELVRGSARALGVVKTGVAVKNGALAPAMDSPEALKAALRAARGIYFPDPVKATAGIHVMSVLRQLGLDGELAGRLRVFPNGASAMKAMADSDEPGLVGCTQITEILYTPGVALVAPLPKAFELATIYTAAVCVRAREPQAARALIELLVSEDAAPLRKACGFE
jgi:molybdate transport system substrate-binding protein